MTTFTYKPEDVEIIIDGKKIEGFAQSELITIPAPEPVPCSHCGHAPAIDEHGIYCVYAWNDDCPGNDPGSYSLPAWNNKHKRTS